MRIAKRKPTNLWTHACLNTAAALVSVIGIAAGSPARAQSGLASIYQGGKTANGEFARPSAMTAAHKTLPFGTLVRVTNRQSGRMVVVRINDRGPYARGRIIDLSPAAAKAIGGQDLPHVDVEVVGHQRAYASGTRIRVSDARSNTKRQRT
ncbi:MAG: septal ring lytic transglycosylase RlpA family protein [Bradyrhizobiaceae bacterium]|nr:septal ring lytic transglycosylase RlpA family protein [Bradyrhizobiaceae bacterium]